MEFVFQIGDRPTVTATFAPNPEELVPTSMEGFFRVRAPDGTQTRFDFTHPDVTEVSAFVFRLKMPRLDQVGNWYVISVGETGIESSSALVMAVEDTEFVDPLAP